MHKATVTVEGEDGEMVYRQRVEELDLPALVALINRPVLTGGGRKPRSDKGKPRNEKSNERNEHPVSEAV